MELIAGLIVYAVLFFFLKEFVNFKSQQIIQEDVFDWMYQVMIVFGALFFFFFMKLGVDSFFKIFLKIAMLLLLIYDIIFYFTLKFNTYGFKWGVLSIIMDILAIPLTVTVIFMALLMYSNCCGNNYGCYYNDC